MQKASANYTWRKSAAMLVMGVVCAAGLLGALSVVSLNYHVPPGNHPANVVVEGLSSFQGYPELRAFIDANAKSAQRYDMLGGFGGIFRGLPVMGFAGAAAPTYETALTSGSTPSYTGTNVQVQGVDEVDRVKTDGIHLFVSTADAVTIMNAYPPNSTAVLSRISLKGDNVLGIEVYQDRLFVVSQRSSGDVYVDLLLYDVSNLSSPRLMENSSIQGSYVSARMAQGYAYAVVQQPSYQWTSGNATAAMPEVYEKGNLVVLPPSSIFYAQNVTLISYYTMIVSMSMSTGTNNVTSVLTGPSSTIYVSTSNIYVVYANYPVFYADGIPGDVFNGGFASTTGTVQSQNSTIFRASYSNGTVSVAAVGSVPGAVLNQFSMDEYGAYFRIATSGMAVINGAATTSDDVYVLDRNMSQVAALRNIAPGENIYAVRFVDDMGYVVTFEQIDPLFAISFRDVTNPIILSALKVTGFSDYLHPLPNGHLIGVGKDAVPASNGDFAWYLGLKLSLFQVFDNGTSTQVSKYLIGDRGTDSPVLNDHLAFTFDSTRNIMVIPVTLAQVSGNQKVDPNSPPPYGDIVWQGVYVFNVTDMGFTLLGQVSQYPASQSFGSSPNSSLQIDRSVIIGNYLYTVSQSEVMVSDLSSFSTLATVPLG
ncbi:MAG TPA: beta-propeller domain-containing protein [Conexivisphaerales archaeon]|nr:beta-propeller domain-containing protein [Conexivisphaerales archaeon]